MQEAYHPPPHQGWQWSMGRARDELEAGLSFRVVKNFLGFPPNYATAGCGLGKLSSGPWCCKSEERGLGVKGGWSVPLIHVVVLKLPAGDERAVG